MPPRGSDDFGDLIERREPNALPVAILAIAAAALLGGIVLQAIEVQGYRHGDKSLQDSAKSFRDETFRTTNRNLQTAAETVKSARQAAEEILGEINAGEFKPAESRPALGAPAGASAPEPTPEVTPSVEPSTPPADETSAETEAEAEAEESTEAE